MEVPGVIEFQGSTSNARSLRAHEEHYSSRSVPGICSGIIRALSGGNSVP